MYFLLVEIAIMTMMTVTTTVETHQMMMTITTMVATNQTMVTITTTVETHQMVMMQARILIAQQQHLITAPMNSIEYLLHFLKDA